MSQKYLPNVIIYNKKGKIYNIFSGICLILGVLFGISALILCVLGKVRGFFIMDISALLILILAIVFALKASENGTRVFL